MDYNKSMSGFTLEKYKDPKSKEFQERLESSPSFRLEGFEEVANSRNEISTLQKEYDNASGQRQIEIRQRLTTLREETAPLDDEQMRVFLKDILDNLHSPELKKFVEQVCVIKLKKNLGGGATLESDTTTGKFIIGLDIDSFYDYGKTEITDKFGVVKKLRYFNPAKVARLLGQALGSILQEPDDWKDHAPQVAILSDKVGSWQDFVAFCLTNPDQAEKIFPEGYKFFRATLDGLGRNKIVVKAQKTEKIENKEFTLDLRSEEEKSDGVEKSAGSTRRFISSFIKKFGFRAADWTVVTILKMFGGEEVRAKIAGRDSLAIDWDMVKERLWKRTDWYQRAVAEHEDKEVSRIKTRNEGFTDRNRSLRQFLNNGTRSISWEDQFMIRSIVLADMKFNDWNAELMHVVLQATDELYRQTKGEEITDESYQFIVRAHRVSNESKRWGTKPSEYKLVMVGQRYSTYDSGKRMMVEKVAHERRYIRNDRESWQKQMLWEVGTKTNRDLGMVAQEVFEYMKIGDNFIEIDDVWDTRNGNEDNKYLCSTGDWRDFVGKEFADNMFNNINHHQQTRKLNPDQIAIMARIIAEEIKYAQIKKMGLSALKPIASGEHAKSIMSNAYVFYKDKFLADPQLRGYVNYYFRELGWETDAQGNVERIPGAGDSDKQHLEEFTKRQQKENPEYQKAHQALEKYDNYLQANENPENLWEEVEGNQIKDISHDDLRDKFAIERNVKDAADDIDAIDKAIDEYTTYIGKKVYTSKLELSAKRLLFALLIKSTDTRNKEFINNEALIILEENSPESFANPAKRLETESTLFELVNGIRPQRRELIRLTNLADYLGLSDYKQTLKDKIASVPTDTKAEDLNGKLTPEEEKELSKLRKDSSKKEKVDQFLEQKWLEKKLAEQVTQLIKNIKDPGFTNEKIQEELEELAVVPEGEINRFIDLERNLHRDKLKKLLQLVLVSINRRYNALEGKINPKIEPKEDKGKK